MSITPVTEVIFQSASNPRYPWYSSPTASTLPQSHPRRIAIREFDAGGFERGPEGITGAEGMANA